MKRELDIILKRKRRLKRLLENILESIPFENLLGIGKKKGQDVGNDPLSQFLSELIKTGNASITIKISTKSKEATRDENGNWIESTPAYPSFNHPLADLLNLPTTSEEKTIPTSLTTSPYNRSQMAMDLLRELLIRSFLTNQVNLPEELLRPAFASPPEEIAPLLFSVPSNAQGTLPTSPLEKTAELLSDNQQETPSPIPPQEELINLIRQLQQFSKEFAQR